MSNRTLNMNDSLYHYMLDTSLREDPVQKSLRDMTASMEWSQMQIAPEQGQFMAHGGDQDSGNRCFHRL